MLKRNLCILLSLIISGILSFQVFAQSNEEVLLEEEYRKQGIDFHRVESEESEEIVDRYIIEDEDENVVYHEVMVAKDGTEYHNTITLISSYVEYDDELGTRSSETSGRGEKTYTHKLTGRSRDGKYFATAEFQFTIKYKWDSEEGTSEMTYAYCKNVVPAFTQMDDIGRARNSAWAKYIDLSGNYKKSFTYTVNKYGDIKVTEK